MRVRTSILTAMLLAIVSAAPLTAQTVTIPEGDDGWVTVGGGSTQVDLSLFPLQLVFPEEQCGKITGPLIVNLEPVPLDPNQLGSIDTIVHRLEQRNVSVGAPAEIPVQLVALSMASQGTFSIGTCGPFSLRVYNSRFGSSPGSMTVRLLDANGGTFDSSFTVTPRLVFTPTGGGDPIAVDCGSTPPPPEPCSSVLNSSDSGWVRNSGPGGFDPVAVGVTPIAAGIAVDGNGTGENPYTTVGNIHNNFYPGFSHVHPFPPAQSRHNHEVAVTWFHQGAAAKDCEPAANARAGKVVHKFCDVATESD